MSSLTTELDRLMEWCHQTHAQVCWHGHETVQVRVKAPDKLCGYHWYECGHGGEVWVTDSTFRGAVSRAKQRRDALHHIASHCEACLTS